MAGIIIASIATVTSLVAFALSGFLFWKQHLKPFQLWCSFQSAIFDGSDYSGLGFHIVLPITVANEGAQAGLVSHWAIYLKDMEEPSKVFAFHGAGLVDVRELLHALGTGDFKSAKILDSGQPALRLAGFEQRDVGIVFIPPEVGGTASFLTRGFVATEQLGLGKYDFELWGHVNNWARYQKVGFELDAARVKSLQENKGFINNFAPAFDHLKPDLHPDPIGDRN